MNNSGFAHRPWERWLLNGVLILICIVVLLPVATTLLISFKREEDVVRKPQLPFYDDRFLIILVYVGFYLPLSVWVAKGFFDTIPRDLEEAAFIDGCSPLDALLRIIVPLALPGLLSIFLLTFVNVWSEF